jgi:hypothetical protein
MRGIEKDGDLERIQYLEKETSGRLLPQMIEDKLRDPNFPFTASEKLLDRPYWQRVWIIQEFCESNS